MNKKAWYNVVAENVRAFSFAKIDLLIRSAYVLSKHNGKLVGRFIFKVMK